MASSGRGAPRPKPSPTPPPYRYGYLDAGQNQWVDVSAISETALLAGESTNGVECPQAAPNPPIKQWVASVWDARYAPKVVAPMWVETLPTMPTWPPSTCNYCWSRINAIDAEGFIAVGEVCDPDDKPEGPGCYCPGQHAMAWERVTTTEGERFVRTTLDDPLPRSFVAVATVNGVSMVIGWAPALWRRSGSSWLREDVPTAPWSSATLLSINRSGLVAGRVGTNPSRALGWDCTTSPCRGPFPLPGVYSGDVWPTHINEAGDVVGWHESAQGGRALAWRYLGEIGGDPAWAPPEQLPLLGRSCQASASEYVAGVLTVVGDCDIPRGQRGHGNYGVRWQSPQSGKWVGPEKIESLDDDGVHLQYALDINTTGRIAALAEINLERTHGCVETPQP